MTRISSLVVIAMMITGLAALLGSQEQAANQEPQKEQPKPSGPGFLGCKLADVSDVTADELGLESVDGVLIMELIPGSPAEKAGLLPRDVIRKMDDTKISDVDQLRAKMSTSNAGQEMIITVIRAKQPKEIKVVLGARPTTIPVKPEVPN